mgnify:CR=1 FL=1
MITEIRRLEHAIQATEIPTHIARDCLGNRQRRIDTDLVQDDAENQLLKVIKRFGSTIESFSQIVRIIYIFVFIS